MSWLCVAWAEKAPVADVYERSILTKMSHRARSDGTGAYPSVASMAEYALCDEQTIRRRLKALKTRGVIAPGDQTLTRHLPGDKRPVVYDLLIPHSWYTAANLEEVNAERAERGEAPLAEDGRPPIKAPEKARKQRDDTGVPKPARRRKEAASAPVDEPAEEVQPMPPEPPAEDDGLSTRYPATYLLDTSRGICEIPNTVPGIPSLELSRTSLAAASPSLRSGELPTEDPGRPAQVVDDQGELGGDVYPRARERGPAREKAPPRPRRAPESYPEPTPDDRWRYGNALLKACEVCGAPPQRLCVKATKGRAAESAEPPHFRRTQWADSGDVGAGRTPSPARNRRGVAA